MPVNPELYFDWAATAIPDQDILEAALKESLESWANPSSVHAAGKEARAALEKARSDCAAVLGVQAKQIFFTSGGTESDHIPLLAILNRPEKGNVAVSAIEHPALREMAEELKKVGIEPRLIPADKNGGLCYYCYSLPTFFSSQNAMLAAAATFSESTLLNMGMRTT